MDCWKLHEDWLLIVQSNTEVMCQFCRNEEASRMSKNFPTFRRVRWFSFPNQRRLLENESKKRNRFIDNLNYKRHQHRQMALWITGHWKNNKGSQIKCKHAFGLYRLNVSRVYFWRQWLNNRSLISDKFTKSNWLASATHRQANT